MKREQHNSHHGPKIGSVVTFLYPVHNRLNMPIEQLARRVQVTAVRDLAIEPLDPLAEFLPNPLERYGRLLVSGRDTDTGEAVDLYWEACNGRKLPDLRLGLYDPRQPGELADWVARAFGPTTRERRIMADAILRFHRLVGKRTGGLKLGVYPVAA